MTNKVSIHSVDYWIRLTEDGTEVLMRDKENREDRSLSIRKTTDDSHLRIHGFNTTVDVSMLLSALVQLHGRENVLNIVESTPLLSKIAGKDIREIRTNPPDPEQPITFNQMTAYQRVAEYRKRLVARMRKYREEGDTEMVKRLYDKMTVLNSILRWMREDEERTTNTN